MPDTKEKPYQCHCGAAFTRRDLLTRHRRITVHGNVPEEGVENSCVDNSQVQNEQDSAHSDVDSTSVNAAAAAAAASLSTMSMHPWSQQHQSIFEPDDAAVGQLHQQTVLHQEPLSHGEHRYLKVLKVELLLGLFSWC